jgi:hypothetical protein
MKSGIRRYLGKFNWYGEVHTLHANACSKDAAFMIFTTVLAKKFQRTRSAIKRYFNGTKDNYTIREEEKK